MLRRLLPLLILVSASLADVPRYWKDEKYDEQDYGAYPQQRFNTSDLVAPVVNIVKWHPSCYQEGDYTFITPRGHKIPHEGKGPMILDTNGTMIWAAYGFDEVYNFQAQMWKGKQYLTFWAGDDRIRGHGQGFYYMYDENYNFVKKIGAVNGLKGDLHEFRITQDNTGVITSYEIIQFDLSPLGGNENGWIWNGVFQEIDLETDKLVFQWNASEHFTADTTYRHFNKDRMGGKGDPYDYFHINSVQKDHFGNFLVSGRYPHAISYINGKTGEVFWQLGGKNNAFKDISEGNKKATDIAGQHDARWHKNFTEITVYDNGAEWDHKWRKESRGVRMAVDLENMTVKLLNEYINQERTMSTSQGSVQILEQSSQNVLLGYGFTCLWAEFDQTSGEELCNVHFQARKSFGHGGCQSYRLMKFPWVGKPNRVPDTKFYPTEGIVYVSWLGSTEVRHWSVIDMSNNGAELKRVHREGFETKIDVTDPLTGEVYPAFAIAALDIHGNHLKSSLVHGSGKITSFRSRYRPSMSMDTLYGALWVVLLLAIAAGAYFFFLWFLARRRLRSRLFRGGSGASRSYGDVAYGGLSADVTDDEDEDDGFSHEAKLLGGSRRGETKYRDESDGSQNSSELQTLAPRGEAQDEEQEKRNTGGGGGIVLR